MLLPVLVLFLRGTMDDEEDDNDCVVIIVFFLELDGDGETVKLISIKKKIKKILCLFLFFTIIITVVRYRTIGTIIGKMRTTVVQRLMTDEVS